MNSPRLLLLCAALLAPFSAAALTLSEAELRMREHDPALAAARIALRGSQGDREAAGRRPVAELELAAGKYSRIEGLGPGRWRDKRLDSTAGVSWTWERGGKRRLRMQAADALVDADALSLTDAARVQRAALHEAYFGLKAAQEALDVASGNRALSAEAMAAVERQVGVGAEAPIARDRLQVEDLKLATELREAELALLDAQQALALLIGHDGDPATLTADDPWPDPEALSASRIDIDQVLAQRPDLRAAEHRVQAAERALALARSQRRRDLGLAVEAEREPMDVAGITWGVSVTVPLNGPDHYRGEIARADADHDLAVLEARQARIEAKTALIRARRAWEQARVRLEDGCNRLLPAANAAHEGMELAYRRGAASLTDLLDARRAAREAEAELIDASFAHAVALAHWQAATLTAPSDESAP